MVTLLELLLTMATGRPLPTCDKSWDRRRIWYPPGSGPNSNDIFPPGVWPIEEISGFAIPERVAPIQQEAPRIVSWRRSRGWGNFRGTSPFKAEGLEYTSDKLLARSSVLSNQLEMMELSV